MEEIAEGLLRAIGGIMRWLVWEIVCRIVLFNIGRLTFLLVTLGRYPRGQSMENDIEKITWAGVFVVFLAWSAVALYNNYI